MKRRGKAVEKTIKTRRNKTLRRNAAEAAPRRSLPAAAKEANVAQAIRERDEALKQQAATAEVLKIISSSTGQLQPIFQTILANAVRICEAKFGVLYPYENETFRFAAEFGVPPALSDFIRQRGPFQPRPTSTLAWLVSKKEVIYCADVLKEDTENPVGKFGGARTYVAVPMLKENRLVGTIIIYRQEVRPFTDKQVGLLTSFASQAVIAIENTRLLNELRESLEQQTATSEVLKIISSSPSNLKPVFHSMLENSVRICEAKFGQMFLCEGDKVRAVATLGVPVALVQEDERRGAFQPSAEGGLARAIRTKKVLHIDDLMSEQPSLPVVKLGGARSYIAVPMLKESELVGVIVIYRQEVRPFTDKQVDLVKNFAAQAVIAIENTRLLNELRESLQQQTATSEVLQVISTTPGELEPVFNTMLANATRICEAKIGVLYLSDGDGFRVVAATHDAPPAYVEARMQTGWGKNLPADGPVRRAAATKQIAHITDIRELQSYRDRHPAVITSVELGKFRTVLAVPMLKDDELIGVITLNRQEVRPFTDKQIALVQNFAAQAVIAIENTRLLNELRQRTDDLSESLEQQTATSEVLRVISSSPGELAVVFDSILDNAVRICSARFANLVLYDEGNLRVVAMHNAPPEFEKIRKENPVVPLQGSAVATLVQTKQRVHILDLAALPAFANSPLITAAGARSMLAVPMLKDGELIGGINIYRQEVKPFTGKQIALLENFAAQAVIAIENARLLNELRERTHELGASLDNLRTTQDRLVQTQKLASLGQLTAGIAHEIKNPLNFVNNFSGISAELITELKESLADVSLNEKRRAEITELMDTLRGNLDKIVQHGKRADAIVKNMLLHSREGSGEHRIVDINALVEEGLNLAYHGARAEKQGFNVTLERSFDPAAGQADVFPQDITRVLLNLISNGFYAAMKRKADVGDGYEPTLMASTRSLGDRVEIRVRDNGTGISPEVKEKIFNPFFTTKPAGEGTGLGLSISHDVIVKQHGGSIDVETEPGAFSEFIIVLPRVGAPLTKSGEPS